MTYKDSAPPQTRQVVSHNRNPSDVLLATFRNQHNETEEKIPFSKKVGRCQTSFLRISNSYTNKT